MNSNTSSVSIALQRVGAIVVIRWSNNGFRGFASIPPTKPISSLTPVNNNSIETVTQKVSATGLLPAFKSKIAEVTNKSAIFEISVGVVLAQYKQIFLSLMRNIFQSFRPLLITVIMGNMLKMAAFLMQFPVSFYSIFFFEVFYGMAQLAISFVFVCFFHNGMSLQTRARQQLLRTMSRNLRRFKHMMIALYVYGTRLAPHASPLKRMTDDNAKFISAGADKYVFLWDVATAKIIRRFARHRGPVNCCDFAGQEQNILLTGSNDKTVMLWDWRAFTNNKPLQTLTEAYDSVQAIKVINEYEVLTGSLDGCLRRYDVRYGRLTVDEFDGQSISCISASSDARYLLLGMLDSGIRLVETQSGRVVKNYKGKHVNRSYKIYCTFDGSENLVLTGSEAGSLAWYDVADDDSTGFVTAPANSGAVLCVRSFESQVLATTQSGEILVYHSDPQQSTELGPAQANVSK
ncbi:wd-repeat protein, putative [Perkinsus marinus ATCC 50983]|uniref:Wd-repeat protein, putative n=1 Tax=Perkinsus marinus (strain ATCC 50983 / TXsc) TaxID=423536 RepID=C5LRX9_PERM5|nr:wd-repeat protein, putative [Perkinsus marinus ATCC 50983]EER00515.1 wd-repeat protein, putative [Perkinsus marinus ATCC 50983]|eukprot:XP_002767797.1 wd-repeat protein, putative [Perkinsus marinus ATCC 50983]